MGRKLVLEVEVYRLSRGFFEIQHHIGDGNIFPNDFYLQIISPYLCFTKDSLFKAKKPLASVAYKRFVSNSFNEIIFFL